MSTEIKRDIFKNPFLDLNTTLWESWTSGEMRQGEMSKSFDYLIVSRTKDSPKEIIWLDPEFDYDADLISTGYTHESQMLFVDYDWNEVYIWDTGSVQLLISESGDDIVFAVDYNTDMEYPNLFVSSPLLHKVYTELEIVLKKIISDAGGLMTISFTNLSENALLPQKDELRYIKKLES